MDVLVDNQAAVSPKTEEEIQIIACETNRVHLFQKMFLDFHNSLLLCQLIQEKVIFLKRKPYTMLFDRSFETGRISVMKGSRRVLVKVVLFQLRGRGHPQDDATPNFFANSKRAILGLSIEVLFVQEIFWKDG